MRKYGIFVLRKRHLFFCRTKRLAYKTHLEKHMNAISEIISTKCTQWQGATSQDTRTNLHNNCHPKDLRRNEELCVDLKVEININFLVF